MISTLTPAPIIAWAICWNRAVSPPAFWMSDRIPAASNAFWSSGASYNVYRVEDVVSGRITPTEPPAPVAACGAVVGGALAVAVGGSVSRHRALARCPVAEEPPPPPEPQPARTSTATVPTTPEENVPRRTDPRARGRAVL